ncbi:MAG: secretion protein HlyD family protein [Chloroflexi bacterium]|nr:secretion protein HlyD family protein [Chloroflexota bacterium]
MKLKIAAAVILVVVGAGAIGFALLSDGSNGTDGVTYLTAQAAVTDVTEEAVASGTVSAATTYALAFGSEPQVTRAGSASAASSSSASAAGGSGGSSVTWPVTEVNVSTGDLVKAGDVLAVADPLYAELQVTIAQANLAAAEARLKSDTEGADALTRRIARTSVTQASNQLAQARQSYTDTVRQNALSVKQAKAAVTAATAQLKKDTAQLKADQAAGAPEQTIAADRQVIAADRKALTQARESYQSAQLRATASNHQAANQITNASLQLTSARNNYSKQVAAADDAQIASDEAAVATAESALAAARAVAEHPTIVAPADGRITAVNVSAGTDAPTGTAISMQSAALAITASFSEDDILDLQVGQKATVTVSATGDTVTGTVASISSEASGTGGSSVVSYAVVILLDSAGPTPSATSSGPGLPSGTPADGTTTAAAADPSASPAASAAPVPLPGMSAEVSITVAEAADVVAVPAAAVSGTSGQYVVRVMGADGQVQARSVEVGLITSSLAEIKSGLSAGDQVVTGTSADQATTTTSSGSRSDRQFPGGGDFTIPGGGFTGPGGLPGGGG